jgi:hypothetical protein
MLSIFGGKLGTKAVVAMPAFDLLQFYPDSEVVTLIDQKSQDSPVAYIWKCTSGDQEYLACQETVGSLCHHRIASTRM